MAGDSASMPTQQSLWCDEPASSLRSGQGRCDGTQQGPVLVGERWAVVLPAQDCELVAEHDDLEILRASRAHSQARQRHEQSVQNATHRTPGCERIMPGQRARPHFWAPTGPHGSQNSKQANATTETSPSATNNTSPISRLDTHRSSTQPVLVLMSPQQVMAPSVRNPHEWKKPDVTAV